MEENTYYTAPSVGPQPSLLPLGILSIVFVGIIGIILGSIGRKKGNAYINAGGTLTGSSKVGFILSKVGLIFGIIEIVVFVLYIVLIIAGVAASGYSY